MNDIAGKRVGQRRTALPERAIGPQPVADGVDRRHGAGAIPLAGGEQDRGGTEGGTGSREQRAAEQFGRRLGQADRILVLGATGFIGRRVIRLLAASGCHVVAGVRRPESACGLQGSEIRAIDLASMTRAPDWAPHLAGIDAVINLVGIFAESGGENTFARVQRDAPVALFEACQHAGIERVIQLSALGADTDAATPFLSSKHAADEALLAHTVGGWVLQPSLVYGTDGKSSVLFRLLASLPLVWLPSGGRQLVQPVHVDDVAAAIVAAVLRPIGSGVPGEAHRRVPLVGPEPLTFARYLALLRAGMGWRGQLRVLSVPVGAATRLAGWLGRWSAAPVNADAVRMLARGNTASATAISALLGRPPLAPEHFIAADDAARLRAEALLGWMPWVLRASVAFLWIATAIVSFGLYPVADSLALLAQAGVPAAIQPLALYGAASLDLAFGVLSVAPRRPTWLWRAQAALILGYMLIITVRLPEYWLHPYGPITKNVPILALIWVLDRLERREWTMSR